MPELQHFSSTTRQEDILAAIRQDGAIIIDTLMDAGRPGCYL